MDKINQSQELHRMVAKLLHDIEKPRANFKMFSELFEEISDDPEKVRFWMKAVKQSFEKFDEQAQKVQDVFRRMESDA